jgi:hypothetical protein
MPTQGRTRLFDKAGPQAPLNLPWVNIHGYGTLAMRPPACQKFLYFFYFATDNSNLYQCQRSGSGYKWQLIASGGGGTNYQTVSVDSVAQPVEPVLDFFSHSSNTNSDVTWTGHDNAGVETQIWLKVIAIQNRAVSSSAPSGGNVLTWNAGSSQWEPAADAVFVAAGGSHAAGDVPDPGSTSHTPAYYLGDDASFHPLTNSSSLFFQGTQASINGAMTAVTNSNVDTDLWTPAMGGTINGSQILVANTAYVGQRISLITVGNIVNTLNHTITVSANFGGQDLPNGSLGGVIAAGNFWFQAELIVEAIGAANTAKVNIMSWFSVSTVNLAPAIITGLQSTVIDTTVNNKISVFGKWNNANPADNIVATSGLIAW